MSRVLLIIGLILISQLTSILGSQTGCHYSCQTCTLPYHQFCMTCQAGSTLIKVKDPNIIPLEYQTNFITTGLCTKGAELPKINILGIILLISSVILVPLTGSQLLFYIVVTLQSFSLLSFIEVDWLIPVSYILNGFQYFIPGNIITRGAKENSWKFQQFSFYYLREYFVEPNVYKALALVGILDIIVIVLLITAFVVKTIKSMYFEQKCKEVPYLEERVLNGFINVMSCLFFLLIQETILGIVISFQFQSQVPSKATAAITIAYVIALVGFIAFITKFKISLFPNKLTQIYALAKKIIFPIFVVLPFNNHFLLILFMGVFCAMEGFFDFKIQAYPMISRNTVFKILQFLCILFFAIFYGVDFNANSYMGPFGVTCILIILLCGTIAFFYLQVGLSIKDKFIKVQAAPAGSNLITENSVLGRTNITQLVSTTKRQATQANLVEDGCVKSIPNRVQKLIIQDDKGSDLQPPKVTRDATKDTFKTIDAYIHADTRQTNIDGSAEVESEEKKKPKKKKQRNIERVNELKKRYGVQ